jgi:diguanylate cyclase (GGDEF)-like protein
MDVSPGGAEVPRICAHIAADTRQQTGRPALAACRLLLGLSILAPALAQAQRYNLHHYDLAEGLPQSQVVAIHQDPSDYLWLGTFGGISRYNGNAFTNFTTADGLPSNLVEAIASADSGRVWIGTGAGLCHHDAGEGFSCPPQEPLASAYIRDLLVDADGVWAASDVGLFHVTADRVRLFGPEEGLLDSRVRSLSRDPAGRLWAGTSSGLGWTAAGGNRFEWIPLPRTTVLSLFATAERLWIGTDLGLLSWRADTGVATVELPSGFEGADVEAVSPCEEDALCFGTDRGLLVLQGDRFTRLTTLNGLADDIVYSILMDREGMTWLGLDSGLDKWVPGGFAGYTTDHGLLDSSVRTVQEDPEGRLWLGTRGGVQIVERRDGTWRFDEARHITAADGLVDERVSSIAFLGDDEALLASFQGVAHWRDGSGVVRNYVAADGLPSNRTQALFRDRAGKVWIGTELGVAVLDGDEIVPAPVAPLRDAYIYRVRQTDDGRLWFATNESGLLILSPDGALTRVGAEDGLTDEALWDIAPDFRGGMWVGSNGDGLFHIDPAGVIDRFGAAEGLTNGFVWQVLQDDAGDVWCYTNRGIFRFDGRSFRHYGEDDGLLHMEGFATAIAQSHDGSLWFGTSGVMRFDPGRAYVNTRPPRVVIERVLAKGQPVADGVELSADTSSIDAHFAALSFQAEHAVRYRYRLRGLSDEWSEPIPRRPITFGGLGGGSYVLEVEAINPDGVRSSDAARFAFSVLAPWWSSAWFLVVAFPLTAAAVWGGVSLRLRWVEAQRRELEMLVRQRTAELEESRRQLELASLTDPLTGLMNRRYLDSRIHQDLAQARRAYHAPKLHPNQDIVFMLIDLDDFKDVNDTYGHAAGDRVLREYGELIGAQLRESDYIVRWGGEEFLVVARQTEAKFYKIIADRILEAARAHRFSLDDGEHSISCLCSLGISPFPFVPRQADFLSWEQIIEVADTATYMAKDRGRNGWVAIHGSETTTITEADEFMRRVKREPHALLEEGEIVVAASADPSPSRPPEGKHEAEDG